MAKTGTKGLFPRSHNAVQRHPAKFRPAVPPDAARPYIIPSVPRPDQKDESTAGDLGSATLHQAADNALATTGVGEVVSAAGGELPETVGQKYSGHGGKEAGRREHAPRGGRNQPSHGIGRSIH